MKMDSSPSTSSRAAMKRVVVSLHGNFYTHKHEDIIEKVKKSGAQVNISSKDDNVDCTHLITSERELNKNKVSKKVKSAVYKASKIVNLEWLLQSITHGSPLPEENFTLNSAKLDQLRQEEYQDVGGDDHDNDDQILSDDGIDQNHENQKPESNSFLRALADNVHDGGAVYQVWKGKEVIYDAILFKPLALDNLKTRHLQLIWSPVSGKYHTWVHDRLNGATTVTRKLGLGDLKSAKMLFKESFQAATGRKWRERHEASEESKYIFLERQYNGEFNQSRSLGLSDAMKSLLELMEGHCATGINGTIESYCKGVIPTYSGYGHAYLPAYESAKTDSNRMRLGVCLLKRLMKQPGIIEAVASENNVFLALTNCYKGLLLLSLVPGYGVEQVEYQIDQLISHQARLSTLRYSFQRLGLGELDNTRSRGLQKIEEVNQSTPEGQILRNYFLFSACLPTRYGISNDSVHLLNIFRVDRGEAKRYEKWRKNKKTQERRLLWHGSPNRNFVSILSEGLRAGSCANIYLAELSGVSKSYCLKDGIGSGNLMLLCEVSSSFSQRKKAPWCDAGQIHPDLVGVKMIDFSVAKKVPANFNLHNDPDYAYEHWFPNKEQIRMRYLFHFK